MRSICSNTFVLRAQHPRVYTTSPCTRRESAYVLTQTAWVNKGEVVRAQRAVAVLTQTAWVKTER